MHKREFLAMLIVLLLTLWFTIMQVMAEETKVKIKNSLFTKVKIETELDSSKQVIVEDSKFSWVTILKEKVGKEDGSE